MRDSKDSFDVMLYRQRSCGCTGLLCTKLVKKALNILHVIECLFVSLESAVSLLPSQP